MKQILSLLIAISLIITSNVYSLPQSRATLRPPLATSKTAKDARRAFGGGSDSEVRGAASIPGTIGLVDHVELNHDLVDEVVLKYDGTGIKISRAITPSKGKELKGLPINLYPVDYLLSKHGIAGHYGIRRLNIFLDALLLQALSPKEKERYFDHEFYELVRIIHYAMKEFGDKQAVALAKKMGIGEDGQITMKDALRWFKEFFEFKKANEKKVTSILDKLVLFLDHEENRSKVEPLLSSIHRQAPELPSLVIARLAEYRLGKAGTDTEYGNLEVLRSRLKDMIQLESKIGQQKSAFHRSITSEETSEARNRIVKYIASLSDDKENLKMFLMGDTEVAKLFKNLAEVVMGESKGTLPDDIFEPVVMKRVITTLGYLRKYASDFPVRGATSVLGTISAKEHPELNQYLVRAMKDSNIDVSKVLTSARQKQFQDLPVKLFSVVGLLYMHEIAGHYGIRRLNIFLDARLLDMLSLEDKELYFSHEFYELVRVIHYGMGKFGNAEMRELASEMEYTVKAITMESTLKWFKKFCDFNKANSAEVAKTLDELAYFLDKAENRPTVAPLLSGIHNEAPELPSLVKAELIKQRLSKPSSESGDYAILKEILRDGLTMGDSIFSDSQKRFLAGDSDVARLFRKLAGEVIQERHESGDEQSLDILNPGVLTGVINKLDILLDYAMEHPVRGAASVETPPGASQIPLGAKGVSTAIGASL